MTPQEILAFLNFSVVARAILVTSILPILNGLGAIFLLWLLWKTAAADVVGDIKNKRAFPIPRCFDQ